MKLLTRADTFQETTGKRRFVQVSGLVLGIDNTWEQWIRFALNALGLTIRQPMAYEKPHHAMLQICRQQRPRELGSRETLLSMVNKKSFNSIIVSSIIIECQDNSGG